MEHRDYLLAQIQEFGRVMGNIMARFLKLKTTEGPIEAAQNAREMLKEELKIDISSYLNLEEKAFENFFKEKDLHHAQLEKLLEYHMVIGEALIDQNKELSHQHLEKALLLYQLIEDQSCVYSFDRIHKEQKIRKLLER